MTKLPFDSAVTPLPIASWWLVPPLTGLVTMSEGTTKPPMKSATLLPMKLLAALIVWPPSTVAPVAPLLQVTAPRVPFHMGLATA